MRAARFRIDADVEARPALGGDGPATGSQTQTAPFWLQWETVPVWVSTRVTPAPLGAISKRKPESSCAASGAAKARVSTRRSASRMMPRIADGLPRPCSANGDAVGQAE